MEGLQGVEEIRVGEAVDAWYTNSAFVRSVRRLGGGLISVLKQERFTAYQEATTLPEAQKPVRWQVQGRQVALREIRDLTLSQEDHEPIRVVLADESWVQTQRIAGRTVRTPQTTHWRWIATPELDPYPPEAIWRAGHQRWGIENHALQRTDPAHHLEHCPHHHPVAIVARLLILLLGFNLFEVFVRLHGKLLQQGRTPLQEVARALDQALEHTDELVPLWSG